MSEQKSELRKYLDEKIAQSFHERLLAVAEAGGNDARAAWAYTHCIVCGVEWRLDDDTHDCSGGTCEPKGIVITDDGVA